MPKFIVKMTETVRWEAEIESEKTSPAFIESLARENWMNGEYTDMDSCSTVGDFSVVQITEVYESEADKNNRETSNPAS